MGSAHLFGNPEARGAISGLSQGVGRTHVARALVEALAYQVRAITDAFAHGGVVLGELRADGGAAAMDLLLELQATNSRVDVERSETIEATARGAASIAGLCAGQLQLTRTTRGYLARQCPFYARRSDDRRRGVRAVASRTHSPLTH